MEGSSFGKKTLLLLIIIVFIILVSYFVMDNFYFQENNDDSIITEANVKTYDRDLYVYEARDTFMYVSEYYSPNNLITYDEIKITEDTKFFLKRLSNTPDDLNKVYVTYDPITKMEFKFIVNNMLTLKINVWLDEENNCKKVLLYSLVDTQIEVGGL